MSLARLNRAAVAELTDSASKTSTSSAAASTVLETLNCASAPWRARWMRQMSRALPQTMAIARTTTAKAASTCRSTDASRIPATRAVTMLARLTSARWLWSVLRYGMFRATSAKAAATTMSPVPTLEFGLANTVVTRTRSPLTAMTATSEAKKLSRNRPTRNP
eukprot:Amastigsp_a677567_8.p2 type:complete len:163 gc:universal Amastigsp_a677567_8:851-363(-)